MARNRITEKQAKYETRNFQECTTYCGSFSSRSQEGLESYNYKAVTSFIVYKFVILTVVYMFLLLFFRIP